MKKLLVTLFLVLLSQFRPPPGYCDDALVLPKGVFRATMDSNVYLPIDRRYNPDGKVEDVAVDYNRALDSRVFPALAPLDPLVPGLPSLGDSIVSFKYDFTILELGFQYGITDRLTAGVMVPYWWVRNKVKSRVNSGAGSSANVGKNAALNRLLPLTTPGTVPLTTQDVKNLLSGGLDINGDGRVDVAGFRFKRFGSWSGNGLGNVEAGFRYQYLRKEDWRLAFTGGVRFPTGRVDDPDNLTDYGWSNGAYALLFRLNNDYIISNLWRDSKRAQKSALEADPGDLVLNGTFRYTVWLPDEQKKRVSSDVNNPLTTNKEAVERNIGDAMQFEGALKYGLLKGLQVAAIYTYGFKLTKDHATGKRGFAYSSLEQETRVTEHIYLISLSYTTLPLYRENRFPIPITGSLSYRNRFAGSNNLYRSQFIGLGLQIFF